MQILSPNPHRQLGVFELLVLQTSLSGQFTLRCDSALQSKPFTHIKALNHNKMSQFYKD